MRNAELNELMPYLASLHESKYDVVVPSTHLGYYEGRVAVTEGRTIFDEEGVGLGTAMLSPTREFESQLAERLDVPARYIEKMRAADEMDLLDSNVNTWMRRSEKNWFVRGFLETGAEVGVARAFLSDRYQAIDHIDAVTATLDGIVAAGIDPATLEVSGDLSPSRLRVKVVAPEITAQAPGFLRAYRNPTTGDGGDDAIQAGVVVTNSETGHGAFQLAPQITVRVCSNGMTRTVDALRKVHLGGVLDTGRIAWSNETRRANITLIREQARDAVVAFLSADYLERVAVELDEKGSQMLERPHEVVEGIGKRLGYSENERQTILDLFTRGGDTSSGGVVNAFTALARDTDDPARAMEIEEEAFTILELAAS
jgi:hypothetical protein